MRNFKRRILNDVLTYSLSIAIFIAMWGLYSSLKNIPLLIPSPISVIKDFFTVFSQSGFYKSVFGTLQSTVVSFLLSFICAMILGISAAFFPVLRKMIAPIIIILRSTPTMAIILLTLIIFTSKQSVLLVGFLIIFPLLYEAFFSSVMGVDLKLIEMSKLYRVKKMERLKYLYIPSILPNIKSVSKSSISMNLKIIISAEVIALSKDTLGMLMQQSKVVLETSRLLAYTIVCVLLSYILEVIVVTIFNIIGGKRYEYRNKKAL